MGGGPRWLPSPIRMGEGSGVRAPFYGEGLLILPNEQPFACPAAVHPVLARRDRQTVAPLGMTVRVAVAGARLMPVHVRLEPPRRPRLGVVRGRAATGRSLVKAVRVSRGTKEIDPPGLHVIAAVVPDHV